MKSYDFICIGGGSAGFNAARVATDLGLRTAVVDGAKDLGGLCILRGCMPSKPSSTWGSCYTSRKRGKPSA